MNTIWISELDEIHLKNGGCSRTAAAYLIVRSAEMELQLTVSITLHSNYFLFTFILLYTIEQQLPSSPQPQFPSTVIKTLPTDIWAD